MTTSKLTLAILNAPLEAIRAIWKPAKKLFALSDNEVDLALIFGESDPVHTTAEHKSPEGVAEALLLPCKCGAPAAFNVAMVFVGPDRVSISCSASRIEGPHTEPQGMDEIGDRKATRRALTARWNAATAPATRAQPVTAAEEQQQDTDAERVVGKIAKLAMARSWALDGVDGAWVNEQRPQLIAKSAVIDLLRSRLVRARSSADDDSAARYLAEVLEIVGCMEASK